MRRRISTIKGIAVVAGMYMASIAGAGFASGQEIMQFFSSYYKGGFYGIILAGILFSAIGCIVLDRVYTGRIKKYDEFLYPLVGYLPGIIVQVIVTLFTLILYFVMTAGLVGLLANKAGIPFPAASAFIALITTIVIINGIRGVAILNMVVMPFLIAGMLIMGLYVIMSGNTAVFIILPAFSKLTDNWFFSSISYVSYNSLMSVVVLCGLFPYLKNRSTGIAGGLAGGFLLCIVALVINLVLYRYYPHYTLNEFPFPGLIQKHNSLAGILYSVILWIAMLISAVLSGYCFLDRLLSLTHIRIDKKLVAGGMCLMAIPFSAIGFSKLIAILYPLFGYAGMFVVFAILLQGLGSVTNRR